VNSTKAYYPVGTYLVSVELRRGVLELRGVCDLG